MLRHMEVRGDGRAEAVPGDEGGVVPVVDAVRRRERLELELCRAGLLEQQLADIEEIVKIFVKLEERNYLESESAANQLLISC